MKNFKNTQSKFVVKNVSDKNVQLLGLAAIGVGKEADLFKAIPSLTEEKVLNALRAPNGQLYKELELNKSLILLESKFLLSSVSEVHPVNIVADSAPEDTQILRYNNGKFEWHTLLKGADLNYNHPLSITDDIVSLPKASDNSNGYLDKDDFKLFHKSASQFRVWQYQDILGTGKDYLYITAFENGSNFFFNKNMIVHQSAVVSSLDRPFWKVFDTAPKSASNHIGDLVMLDSPTKENAKYRVYFLINLEVGTAIPDDYICIPNKVKQARIEVVDAADIEVYGEKKVHGNKTFTGQIRASKGIEVAENISASTLRLTDKPRQHFSLVSNGVGDGAWSESPYVNSEPPVNPYDGQLFVKNTDFSLYLYDGKRERWLGETLALLSFKNNVSVSNSYLDICEGISMLNYGFPLPFDCVLTGINAYAKTSHQWGVEIHKNNNNLLDASLKLENSFNASTDRLNISFNKDDRVSVFLNGAGVMSPVVHLTFKKTC